MRSYCGHLNWVLCFMKLILVSNEFVIKVLLETTPRRSKALIVHLLVEIEICVESSTLCILCSDVRHSVRREDFLRDATIREHS